MPSRTGITYKALSKESPKKKHRRGLPWPLPELSKMGPPVGVKFSANHKILMLLLNLVLVLLALLMGLVLVL